MKTLMDLATHVGEIVEGKRALYGDSIGSSAAALTLLFPGGVPLERYDDVLFFARTWDKLQRLATNGVDEGEDPCLDLAGYAICQAQQRLRTKEIKQRWQGSVSGPDAPAQSKAQPASVEPGTRPQTTTSASEKVEPQPSPLRVGSLWRQEDAPASTAPESACASEAVRAFIDRVRFRNSTGHCGICSNFKVPRWMSNVAGGEYFYFCTRECRSDFNRNLRQGAL